MDFLPWTTFERIVHRYRGDHRTRVLTCAEQFLVMAFAHGRSSGSGSRKARRYAVLR
jgi:hypothetical protein